MSTRKRRWILWGFRRETSRSPHTVSRIGCSARIKMVSADWRSFFEMVQRQLGLLADLNEAAVGITHVATPFPAVIFQRLGKRERTLVAPLLVAGPDILRMAVRYQHLSPTGTHGAGLCPAA